MNILILAAGYATRLYPLTLNKAKPLLEVAGKPMIDWVIDNLASSAGLEKIYIVTNDKFALDFQDWADDYSQRNPGLNFKIINDGTKDPSNMKGAIGDIHLVIHQENLQGSDLMVVAGDNLFSESQEGFAAFAADKPACIGVYDVKDLEEIKKYGSIIVDNHARVLDFVEKPQNPESTLAGIALYYYRKDVLPLIDQYIAEGNNPDQPGRLVAWLYSRVETYAYPISGLWYDIGGKESLEASNEVFRQFVK